MPKTRPTKEVRSQKERFIEAARDLGCDEGPEAFKDRLKQLVKAPPPETVQKRKDKKSAK